MAVLLNTLGIKDAPTQRALRELDQGLSTIAAGIQRQLDDITDELGDVTGGVSAVTSVTSGSPEITVTPTVGDVVVSVDLSSYSLVGHTHVKADITDFAHTHIIADVTGLQAALDDKVAEVIAGAGLTGGGSTGSVTLNVGAGTGIIVNADSIEIDPAVVFLNSDITVTENTLAKGGPSDTLVDSGITDDGSQVWVGTTLAPRGVYLWGTDTASVFNFNVAQDTYIRGGKAASAVHIGDINGGGVYLGAAGNGVVTQGNHTVNLALTVLGNATIGNAGTDAHAITGTVNFNATAGTNGQILGVTGGLPQWGAPSTFGVVDGSGSTNTIPKWTPDGDTLGDSNIQDNGTTIFLGSYANALGDFKVDGVLTVDGDTVLGNTTTDFTTVNGRLNINAPSGGSFAGLQVSGTPDSQILFTDTSSVINTWSASPSTLTFNNTGGGTFQMNVIGDLTVGGGVTSSVGSGGQPQLRLLQAGFADWYFYNPGSSTNLNIFSAGGPGVVTYWDYTTGLLTHNYALNVNGNTTLGNDDSDSHLLRGIVTVQASLNSTINFVNSADSWAAGVSGSYSDNFVVIENGVEAWTRWAAGGQLTHLGNLTVTGNVTLGNAASDFHTLSGNVTAGFDNTYFAWDELQRAGLMKKAGQYSRLAYAASTSFGVQRAITGSTISTSETYSDVITWDASGSTTAHNDLTVHGSVFADYYTTTSGIADMMMQNRGGSGTGRMYLDAGILEIGATTQGAGVGAAGDGDIIMAGALHNQREFIAPQITSNQNDYNPTQVSPSVQWDASHSSTLYVSSDAARDITGLAVGSAAWAGRHVWIYNTGSFAITLKHQSGSSTAGQRFYGLNNADVVLQPRTGAHLLFSTQMGDWIIYELATNLTGYVTGSGTTNYLPKWTSGSGLGNSIAADQGSFLSVAGYLLLGGDLKLQGNELHFRDNSNATDTGYINYYSYAGGATQFRNLIVADGKGATAATFTGSDKSLAVVGNLSTSANLSATGTLTVNGNATLGDATTDSHVINGTVNATVGTGNVFNIVGITQIRSSAGGVAAELAIKNGASGAGQEWRLMTRTAGTDDFVIRDVTGGVDAVVIRDADQRVGINTAAASITEQLFVTGNIRATGTIRANTGLYSGTVLDVATDATLGTNSSNTQTLQGIVNVATGPLRRGSINVRTLIAVQTFTSGTSTYSPTTGTKVVRLRMVGGGGGSPGTLGAASSIDLGGGGASGAYVEWWLDPDKSGSPLVVGTGTGNTTITGGTYVIGAAGAAGTSGGGAGGTGGDTTIVIQGTTFTAKGGIGGNRTGTGSTSRQAAPGQVGSGSGANASGTFASLAPLALAGDNGQFGYRTTNTFAWAGNGGSNPLGLGGRGQESGNTVGSAGTGYGAGGGGSVSTTNSQTGAAGTAGVIIIEEYA